MSKHPLTKLWSYARAERSQFLIATTYTVVNKVFDIFPEILLGLAIDVISRGDGSFVAKFGIVDPRQQIYFLAVVTFVIFALESWFQFLYSVRWRGLAQLIQHKLRKDTYSHVQSLDMEFFENQQSGNLIAILNDDVNQLERFLDSGATNLIHLFATVVLVSIYFFSIAPKVAVFAMTPIPLIVFGGYYFQKRLGPKYKKVRDSAGELNSKLNSNIAGIATIKSYVTEDAESAQIEAQSTVYMENNEGAIQLSSAFIPVIRIAIVCGFMATMVLGGLQVLDGNLNAGLYSSLLFLTQRLLWPFTSLAQTMDMYQRAMASTNRVMGLLETTPHIVNPDHPQGEIKKFDIEFKAVDFKYSSSKTILEGLSICVPEGKNIGVVGTTGSGKSTLVKLLMRLYDPTAGGVFIGGDDIRSMHTKTLRQSIGYVSQEVFLINGTVEENIRFNQKDKDYESVVDAAVKAEAHEFIENLPDGYQTMVGERGQKLSGGQRQRLSIARAILKNPPILILDEATASVDNETEAAIQRSLDILIKDRTTIIIAHRLSTIRKCDEIYVLEGGKIVEQGSHSALIAMGKRYVDLWRVQTGES